MTCKYFKDYCEPGIKLTEYCKILHKRNPRCNCGQKNLCECSEKYREIIKEIQFKNIDKTFNHKGL